MFRQSIVVAVIAGLLVGSATAAQAQSANEIRACIDGTGHYLKDSGQSWCTDDHVIVWNRQGPAGPAGAPGPQGERGPAGALAEDTAARLSGRLASAQTLEAKLATTQAGSKAERRTLLALLRLQRLIQADLISALSPES